MSTDEKIKAHCNECLNQRDHYVLHEEEQRWNDRGTFGEVYGSTTFRMIKCCGCSNVGLQESSWCSEEIDADGSLAISYAYYPPAVSRAKPRWLSELHFFRGEAEQYIAELFHEIYSALHNDSRRLAVMGIRALLEHLMITTLENDYGTFAKNLENFQVQGNLSTKQRSIIETVLEAGHAAMHRGYDPSEADVNTIVTLTETLVETLLIHTEQSAELSKRVPRRNKTAEKK